jgi:hypothetical protein
MRHNIRQVRPVAYQKLKAHRNKSCIVEPFSGGLAKSPCKRTQYRTLGCHGHSILTGFLASTTNDAATQEDTMKMVTNYQVQSDDLELTRSLTTFEVWPGIDIGRRHPFHEIDICWETTISVKWNERCVNVLWAEPY